MKQQKKELRSADATLAASAAAHANIALIKYWGKRSVPLNLPAVGSISLTLDALKTKTQVAFEGSLQADFFELNGTSISGESLNRVSAFLDTVVAAPHRPRARIISTNNFPTGAGLASSASGYAALALSASSAMGQHLDKKALSQLARRGSGSAARSIYGGFVQMLRGEDATGKEDYAVPLADETYWDLRLLIAVTSTEQKSVGSTEGMKRTAATSPFYSSWIEAQPADLAAMRDAVKNKKFEKLGALTEHSCFKMHGLAMSARPPLLYWNEGTIETIQTVWDLRSKGVPAYVTMDAGPQVKILCMPEYTEQIQKALKTINGIKKLWVCKPGPAATLISR